MTILSAIELLKYAAPILIGMLLNRCGLSANDLFLWEQILFYQNAVSFSFLWASSQVQLSALPVDAHREKKHAFAVLTGSISFCLGILLFIYLSYSSHFSHFSHFSSQSSLSLLIPLALFFQISGHWLENDFYMSKQYYTALFSAFITHAGLIIYVPLVYLLLPSGQAVFWALGGMITIFGLRTLFWWFKSLNVAYFRLFFDSAVPLFRSVVPLWGSFLVAGSAFYFDGWLVEQLLPAESFLYFRYGARELPVSTVLASGISATFTHQIAQAGFQNLTDLREKIKTKIQTFQRLVFVVSLGFLLGSSYLFEKLYHPRYVEASYIFDGFLLLVVSRVIFPQSFIVGLKMSRTMFQVSVAELGIHVIFSAVFTYYYGLAGIVIGTITAYFFEKTAYIYLLHRKGIVYFSFHPLAEYIIFSSILGFTFLLKYIIFRL